MVRHDSSGMLASFLLGTGQPAAEVEDIIRAQFPGSDAAAVVKTAQSSQ